ncbi:hypothetical protein RW1_035_00720 [Rhodococcus wratislaviensis NBRC 100605]|uniref:Lsr2 dimerization domain-containing protein n=1 Tax=Rhodococcus wratislaviensis NBRC 100605 TaxID=1219028 RepID=X0Q6F0_RHOWR|nr:hypothetical protein RW1_035_00720 [Rhodococcus wratislaviensis NBRC 100605]
MARKIVVEHIDDIDGTPIKKGKGETIAFSVDGVDYEIDLKDKNAKEFHTAPSPTTSSTQLESAVGSVGRLLRWNRRRRAREQRKSGNG